MRLCVLAQQSEQLVIIFLLLCNQILRVIFRIVLRILLNQNLLYKPELSEEPLIVLVRIDHLIFDDHYELIYVITESLSYLNSEVPYCLIVIHLNIVADIIWSQNYYNRTLLELIILLLYFSLQSLLPFVPV
jgi:hypothetical protein